MSINVGSWDRVLRVVVGLVLIGLAATGTVARIEALESKHGKS